MGSRPLAACGSLVLAVLLLHCYCATAELVNAVVNRKIDLTDVTEIIATTVTLRNDGEEAEHSFILPIDLDAGAEIGDFFVVPGKRSNKKATEKLPLKRLDDTPDRIVKYQVSLPSPLPSAGEVTVTVYMDILSSLRPVPSEIKARESQYMRYSGNVYFYSPYVTEEMKTVLSLGSSRVTTDFSAPEPSSLRGSTATLGPYSGVAGHSSAAFALRFRNDRGFLVARSADLHYDVSHWGRVGVQEEFEVENVAARLVGEWSRADYNARTGRVDPTAHGDVWANLPRDAHAVEYKDLIGNVTTSRLRRPTLRNRALQLVFRFPLLGGWRNHFWYTYDLLLERHVASDGDAHVATVPVFPSLNYDLLCRRLEVRVSLPEGATNIELVPHSTADFAVKLERRKSSLSFTGRPTVILSRENIRSRSKHAGTVQIRYQFSRFKLFFVPVFGVSSVVSVLLGILAFARLNWVLVRDEDEEERQLKIKAEMKSVMQTQASIAGIYLKLQGLYNDVCRGTVDDVHLKRTSVSASLVKNERALEDAGERLAGLLPGRADAMKKLLDALKQKREYSMRFLSIENAFHSGQMQQSNYEEEMRRTVPVSKSLSKDVSNLFEEVTANY